jgi:ubiquinone/menaquinone biosynthesis C-methylase UbiE
MGVANAVELREQGVAELSDEASAQYDAATCSLVFSELTEDERIYTLRELRRLLKPGGLLLIAAETRPTRLFKRMLYWLAHIPLAALTFILTQKVTSAIVNLPAMIGEAGFILERIRYSWLEDLTELVCLNPGTESD